MIRLLKRWAARKAFAFATRHLDRAIAEARAKHGRVREAQRAKRDAVHAALADRIWR